MIKEDWVECRLGEILFLSKEKHKPEKIEKLFYVGLEHIEKNTGRLTSSVKFDEIKTIKNKFEEGQILYGKLRPYFNKVYLSKEKGVCSTDILVFQPSKYISSQYIFHLMRSREFVNAMSSNMSGVNLPRVST
ncbi:MAG: restriction endonuclease subunit S, partial [Bacteroidota bacterium]